MARFRLTVEVRAAPSATRRTVRRPGPATAARTARRPFFFTPARSRWLRRFGIPVVLLLLAAGTVNYLRPIPATAATTSSPAESTIPGSPPTLPWPGVGSAAVGASGLGLIATSGDAPPAPAASVAKVMTALVVLTDKPLSPGADGPTLIITDEDVASYRADAADQQSVVAVATGERLSEFQALEALLIPSGNNIAETLARWDAGSVSGFVAKMNQQAAQLHLTHTTFADPAGVSLQTVSTPTDLLALGMEAMKIAVFAQIVNLPQTILPVAGTLYNVNGVLGQSGIIGIKTGSGLNSGANFLFAATATVDGSEVTLYGSIMGQHTLDAAFTEAQALIATMKGALTVRHVVSRGGVVGVYQTQWGSRSDLVANGDVTVVQWPGMILRRRLDSPVLALDGHVPSGAPAGNLHIELGDQRADVPLITAAPLEPPGFAWRLLRVNLF